MDQQEEDAQAEAAAYHADMARKAAKLAEIAALANSVRDFLDAMDVELDDGNVCNPYDLDRLQLARWSLQAGFMYLRLAVTKPTSF